MSEREDFVKSCLSAKSSQSLQDEVEDELKVKDPEDGKAIASLVGDSNECTDKHKSCGCGKRRK